MNFDSFNRDMKKTSIKCHHPPGGNTNFSLGWTKPEPVNAKVPFDHSSHISVGAVNLEDKENMTIVGNTQKAENLYMNSYENSKSNFLNFQADSKKNQAIKTDYSTGKNNFNIFNEKECDMAYGKASSIKVTYAPGGKSNVIFGDDNTSYNEYRKKR